MSVSAALSSTSSYYTLLTSSTSSTDSTSDEDTFLEMLIANLKYQDSLDGNSDNSTTKKSQNSTLETAQNLSDKDDSLTNTAQAVSLVGKTVTVQITDGNGNVTVQKTGIVSTIKFINGVPKLVINGVDYSLSDVTEITAN